MVQPAPRMMSAPLKKRKVVVMIGMIGGLLYDAANRVEKRQGKNR